MHPSLVFISALPLLASLSITLARPLRLDSEDIQPRSVAELDLDLDIRDAIAILNEVADRSYEDAVYGRALEARATRGRSPRAPGSRGGVKRPQRKGSLNQGPRRAGSSGKRSSGGGSSSGGSSNGGNRPPGMIGQVASTATSVAAGSVIGHGGSKRV